MLLDHIIIIASAFLLGIVDASFGMGYGTILTPVLLMVGFEPLAVIPAVLISQLSGNFLAALFHHRFENVDLSASSVQLRIAVILSFLGLAGSALAVVVAVNLPILYLSIYIGIAVACSGLIVLAARKREMAFSWSKLLLVGSFASFNKGMSGGGYGPVIVAGQLLAGATVKGAIGITTLAEGITCAFAALVYFFVGINTDWLLTVSLLLGVIFSAPVAAFIVKKIEDERMKIFMGIVAFALGVFTITSALLS